MEKENNLLIKNISGEILKVFEKFLNEDLLVVNRSLDASYFNLFADSMFHYQTGVVLVERFFKKNKCRKKGTTHKSYKQKDIDLMNEFRKFTEDIPDVKDLSEEEVNKINIKINEYKSKISVIEADVSLLKTYQYDEYKLMEIHLLDKAYLQGISLLYAEFATVILSTSMWNSLKDIEIIVKTIEYDDYIDLIVFPVK